MKNKVYAAAARDIIVSSAKINEAIKMGLINITGSTVFLFPEIMKTGKAAENFAFRLFEFCLREKYIKENETLSFKHMESGDYIGTYNKKQKAVLLV
ncbi:MULTISPECIES: hypothetical protein [Olivibacter]|uniref:Uncharacterized protein n=1 Tax=Olivibacter jilunii TaxID=985016 RepID=A0ABW6AZC9_9SPHI